MLGTPHLAHLLCLGSSSQKSGGHAFRTPNILVIYPTGGNQACMQKPGLRFPHNSKKKPGVHCGEDAHRISQLGDKANLEATDHAAGSPR